MWVSSNKLPQCLWIHVVPGPSITPNPHELTPVNVTISHLWCPRALVLVKTASVLSSGWRFGLKKNLLWLNLAGIYCLRSLWLLKSLLLWISQEAFCLMLLNIIHYHVPLKCFLRKQQCVAESFWQQCHCCLPPSPVLTVSLQGCQSVWLWYPQRKESLKAVVVAWCLGDCFKRPNNI